MFKSSNIFPTFWEFLRSACSLLRSAGKLLIGVPKCRQLFADQYNLLNIPPHHTTHWPMAVFTDITAVFPLQPRRIVTEPLASYHVYDYAHTYLTKLLPKSSRRSRLRASLVGDKVDPDWPRESLAKG
jgi:hypothetical protein